MKNPHIVKLVDVEMIRDGGSYAAYVLDQNGEEYTLFLEVKLKNIVSEKYKLKSFHSPVLRKVQGESTIKIDWRSCKNILSLPHNIENETHLEWLSQMKKVTNKSGKAPMRMKISGPWRKFG